MARSNSYWIPLIALAAMAAPAARAAIHTAGTHSEYVSAMQKAVAGDTVKLTADISVPCDTSVKAGVTLDLNQKKMVFPDNLPDGRPSRGLAVEGGNITVKNGTIDNGKWAIYAFRAASGFYFQDLKITRTRCFLKLGAAGEGVTSKIRVDGVDIQCDNDPWTIVDLGPGQMQDIQIRNLNSKATITKNDTGSDGIGIETVLDTVILENVKIDGCSGDAIDVKGTAIIRDATCINAARQSFKVWGKAGVTSEFTRCVAYNNGQGGMCNAGIVTMTDCYLEGGRDNSTAFFWGVGKTCGGTDHWGNPDTYGCGGVTATVTRCQFMRHGGASVLLTAESGPYRPADVKFIDCAFFNPGHPNLYVGPNYLLVDGAMKNQWPSNFINCRYEDIPNPGGTTGGGGGTGGTGGTTTDKLTVVFSAAPSAAKPGETVTLTFNAINATTRGLKNVALNQQLPNGMKMVAGSAKLDSVAVNLTPDANNRIALALGDMPSGTSHSLTVQAVVQ